MEQSEQIYQLKDEDEKQSLSVRLTNNGFRLYSNDEIRFRGDYQGHFEEDNISIIPNSTLDTFLLNYSLGRTSTQFTESRATQKFHSLFN